MSTHIYTVKGIAERIAMGNDPGEVSRVVEQIRYWTREGLLKPITSKHPGSGRWRRYDQDQVYRAALLAEMARVGLSIGAMKIMGIWLKLQATRPGDDHRELWSEAIEGEAAVYLVLWSHSSSQDWFGHLAREPLTVENEVVGRPTSTLVIDLSLVFKALR